MKPLSELGRASVEVQVIVDSVPTTPILAILALLAILATGEYGSLNLKTCGPEARAPREPDSENAIPLFTRVCYRCVDILKRQA